MMALYRSILLLIVGGLQCGSALAQDAQPINPVDTNRIRALGREADGSTVSSSIAITMPVGASADVMAVREAGLKAFYDIAARSCDLVIQTIADACELTRVNSNVGSRDRPGQVQEISISGQITMSVKFKSLVGKTP